MVSRNEVFAVANGLHAAGERVSVRAVRERLHRGGSFGDVGPPLAQWKLERNWRAKPAPKEIPAELQDLLNEFAARLWAEARRVAAAGVADERARLVAKERAELEVGAEIGAAADALARRVEELEGRLQRAERDHREREATLRRELEAARRRPTSPLARAGRAPRARKSGKDAGMARAFWHAVMLEAAAVIRARGGGVADAELILLGLSVQTRESAASYGPFTPGVLAKKMAERARRGRLFRQIGPGMFELLAESAAG